MKSHWNSILRAYRDGFVSVLPYVVLMAAIILVHEALRLGDLGDLAPHLEDRLTLISSEVNAYFPLILLVAIMYQVALRLHLPVITSVVLTVAIYVGMHAAATAEIYHATKGETAELGLFVILLPVVVGLLHRRALKLFAVIYVGRSHINASLSSIYPALLTFFACVFLFELLALAWNSFPSLPAPQWTLSSDILFAFRTIISHLFWYVGLHGVHAADMILGSGFLVDTFVSNTSYEDFYNVFAIAGGSGSGLALLIALMIWGRDTHSRRISRMSIPFVLFNINETLIYGLPIVLNPRLLLPFVFVPVVNIVIGYIALLALPITMHDIALPWITPVFINGYLASDGNLLVPFIQAIQLWVGVMLYGPFIRAYSASQSAGSQRRALEEQLNVNLKMRAEHGLKFDDASEAIIRNNQAVEKLMSSLNDDQLLIYYQPKVNLASGQCNEYEALLRFRQQDGSVSGPFFLQQIEMAGLAPVIDLWVCRRVRQEFDDWHGSDNSPTENTRQPPPLISINLHPDTMACDELIDEIIKLWRGCDVEFELLERSLVADDDSRNNLNRLSEAGFTISIDDFGTGYSSFETLCTLPIDKLKLDKSLVDRFETDRGFAVGESIVDLCQRLDLKCVAEGVETETQLRKVASLGVHSVQGWFFSAALPADQAATYTPRAFTPRSKPVVSIVRDGPDAAAADSPGK